MCSGLAGNCLKCAFRHFFAKYRFSSVISGFLLLFGCFAIDYGVEPIFELVRRWVVRVVYLVLFRGEWV